MFIIHFFFFFTAMYQSFICSLYLFFFLQKIRRFCNFHQVLFLLMLFLFFSLFFTHIEMKV